MYALNFPKESNKKFENSDLQFVSVASLKNNTQKALLNNSKTKYISIDYLSDCSSNNTKYLIYHQNSVQ